MLSPLPLVIPAQAGLVNCIARRGLRSDAAIQFNNSIRLTNSGRLYGRLLMLPTGLPRRFKQSPRNDEEGELPYLLLFISAPTCHSRAGGKPAIGKMELLCLDCCVGLNNLLVMMKRVNCLTSYYHLHSLLPFPRKRETSNRENGIIMPGLLCWFE